MTLKQLAIIFAAIIHLNGTTGEPFAFKHFLIRDGLPSNQVYQIVQDAEGYLWLATDRGVCRYDGYHFKTFTRKDGLTDEVVFGFFPEDNGRLWFYTYKGGVCYYHNGKVTEPAFNQKLLSLLEELHYPTLISMFVDQEGTVWIGSERNHIFRISRNNNPELLFGGPGSGNGPVVLETGSKPYPGFIYSGGTSTPHSNRLIYYSGVTGRPRNIFLPGTRSGLQINDRIKLYPLGRNSFICAFASQILKIVNGKVVQEKELGKGRDVLYALLRDKEGNLWAGTRDGVFCFEQSDLSRKPKHYLPSVPVSSAWQDHEGGYWFTSLKKGIYYLPHLHIQSVAYEQLKSQENNVANRITANSFGVYLTGSDNHLLIFPGGDLGKPPVIREVGVNASLTPTGDKVETYMGVHKMTFNDTVAAIGFSCYRDPITVRNDDRSPHLWKHVADTFSVIPENTDAFLMDFPCPLRGILCAAATRDLSGIWMGTASGLFRYHGGQISNMGKQAKEFRGRISDLDMISEHLLLVTTRGNGVLKYDTRNGTITRLTGIPNEYCTQSYVDTKGVVWVSSFSGVTRVDGIAAARPVYNHFSAYDGLISNEVFQVTEYRDRIYAVTGSGISCWDRYWKPDHRKVPVAVKRFTVNGKDYGLKKDDRLKAGQNYIEFFFNALSFQRPVEYQYRLKGLHSNWISTTDRSAVYAALKPGEYTFELKSPQELTARAFIPFTIVPPFWQSTWFWVITVMLMLAGLIFVLQVRYRIILKENKLYQLFVHSEQKALRAQINPHFLFNTFNSILELLARKEYLFVNQYMKHLAHLMRMVLRHSREEEVTLEQEVKLLQLYLQLEKLRFGSKLRFHIHCTDDLRPAELLLPSLLLQPYVENALKHGICSRTDDQGYLQVSFAREASLLVVRIADNGTGYHHTARRTGSKKSYGMKINGERIQLFNEQQPYDIKISALYPSDEQYPGTLVILSLPLKINHYYETTCV